MQPMMTTHLSSFVHDLLLPHKSFASMTRIIQQCDQALPIDVSDAGVVLDALNTLAEIRLEAFAEHLENNIGEVFVKQTGPEWSVTDVFVKSPGVGPSGDSHAGDQKGTNVEFGASVPPCPHGRLRPCDFWGDEPAPPVPPVAEEKCTVF